jgi:hypothetical protein
MRYWRQVNWEIGKMMGKQELYNQEMSHKTQSQRHIFGAPICMEFLKIFGGRPYRLAFWNGAHVAFVALWVA